MINPPFVDGYYYHIYNRGVEKRPIFNSTWDYYRFFTTLNYYRISPLVMKLSDFRRGKKTIKEAKDQKQIVEILAYCLMPNHFHLLIKQESEEGITKFLKKITNSYTRYFNTKYDRIGPLMQGTFKAKLIDTDEYLLQLSKYIHRNPFSHILKRNISYPYSSYSHYLSNDSHPFCNKKPVLSYFSNSNPNLDYKNFVEEGELDNPKLFDLLIDPDEK